LVCWFGVVFEVGEKTLWKKTVSSLGVFLASILLVGFHVGPEKQPLSNFDRARKNDFN
jgi:hypothetical protein